jgi:hypothetical protein
MTGRAPRIPQLRLTHPVVPEHAEQAAVNGMLAREIAPAGKVSRDGVVWFSVDVAMFFGDIPGAGRGIVDGLPDLWFLWNGGAYLIELKARDGALSEAQKAFIAAGLCAAIHVGVACDVPGVLNLLDSWGIPRKRRVRVAG